MNSKKQFSSKAKFLKGFGIGLELNCLLKTRLWRGFEDRLPESSQKPTRQLVAVLVDSVCIMRICFDAFGPKDGGSRILYNSPIREILCGV